MVVKEEVDDNDLFGNLALLGSMEFAASAAPHEAGEGDTMSSATAAASTAKGSAAAGSGGGASVNPAVSARGELDLTRGHDSVKGDVQGSLSNPPSRSNIEDEPILQNFDSWMADPENARSIVSTCKEVHWVETDFGSDLGAGQAAGEVAVSDVDWDRLPINDSSMNAKLPTGGVCISLTRIRGTINEYVSRTSEPNWFASFKIGTVQALQRRLLAHTASIMGKMHVDVQIGFRQLKMRVASLLFLHRALRGWLEIHEDYHLVACILPARELGKFHEARQTSFASDLKLVFLYARFHYTLRRSKSVCKAMRGITADYMLELASACSRDAAVGGEDLGFKPAPLEPCDGAADSSASKVVKTEQKPAKRSRTMLVGLSNKIPFKASATGHLAKLFSDGLKSYLFAMPKDFVEDEKMTDEMVKEMESMCDIWHDFVTKFRSDEDDKLFGVTLKAVATVFACCQRAEGAKPQAMHVRAARKTILDGVATGGVGEEVSKAIVSYEVGQVAMAHAKSHAAAGLEDLAADAAFAAVMGKFEKRFAQAYDDVESWLDSANDGHGHDMRSIGKELPAVTECAACLSSSLSRWSAASLSGHMENVVLAIANCVEIVSMCSFIMLRDCDVHLSPLLSMLGGGGDGIATPTGAGPSEAVALVKREPSPEPLRRDEVGGVCDVAVRTGVLMTRLQTEAARLKSDADILVRACREAAQSLLAVFESVHKRVGEAMDPYTEEMDGVRALLESLNLNSSSLNGLFEYLEKGAQLVEHGWARAPLLCNNPKIVDMMLILAPFARLRNTFNLTPISFRCGGIVEDLPLVADFTGTIRDFLGGYGQTIYDEVAGKFIAANVERIANSPVKISSVHMSILEDTSIDDVIGLLVLKPGLEELAKLAVGINDGADIAAAMQLWDHNKTLKHLQEFVDASGVVQMMVPGVVSRGSSLTVSLPSADALILLGFLGSVLDVSILAAVLHQALFVPAGKQEQIEHEEVFGKVTALVVAYKDAVTKLDNLMDCDAVLSLETSVLLAEVPFDLVRQWRGCMSSIGGTAQTVLLRQGVGLLVAAIGKSKASCPSWEAAFEGGEMNMIVATKVLKNKLKFVAATHNTLHSTLVAMNTMAKKLLLVPKLQDHDETSECIAVAIACLGRSSQASVAIQAVDLLTEGCNDRDAPEKAKKFLIAHKNEKNKELPAALWRELQNLSELAVRVAAPALTSKSASPGLVRKAGSSESLTSTTYSSPAKSAGAVSFASPCDSKAPSVKSESLASASSPNVGAPTGGEGGGRSLKRFKRS